jgi:hypothetical protein
MKELTMKLTITVRKTAAPQKIETADGVVVVKPGESITAEMTPAQAVAVRAASGHFEVTGAK